MTFDINVKKNEQMFQIFSKTNIFALDLKK